MGILSEIHPTGDGTVTVGPVRADDAADLQRFAERHAGHAPKGVNTAHTISGDGLTAVFTLAWTEGDDDELRDATKWSTKVQDDAAKSFLWGGSG
jgi:hypothetical protein